MVIKPTRVRFEAVLNSMDPMFPQRTYYNENSKERSASIFFTSMSSLTSPLDSLVLQSMTSTRSRSAKPAVIDGDKPKRTAEGPFQSSVRSQSSGCPERALRERGQRLGHYFKLLPPGHGSPASLSSSRQVRSLKTQERLAGFIHSGYLHKPP